jgi:hypothetical protein
MRKIGIVVFTLIFLLTGCIETSTTTVSVKETFTKAGNGTITTTVENAGDQLNLKGKLDLKAGEFNIYLSNPSGDTIYSKSYNETGTYKIDEKFDRIIGEWVFSYSISGVDNESPAGSFEYDLIYKD